MTENRTGLSDKSTPRNIMNALESMRKTQTELPDIDIHSFLHQKVAEIADWCWADPSQAQALTDQTVCLLLETNPLTLESLTPVKRVDAADFTFNDRIILLGSLNKLSLLSPDALRNISWFVYGTVHNANGDLTKASMLTSYVQELEPDRAALLLRVAYNHLKGLSYKENAEELLAVLDKIHKQSLTWDTSDVWTQIEAQITSLCLQYDDRNHAGLVPKMFSILGRSKSIPDADRHVDHIAATSANSGVHYQAMHYFIKKDTPNPAGALPSDNLMQAVRWFVKGLNQSPSIHAFNTLTNALRLGGETANAASVALDFIDRLFYLAVDDEKKYRHALEHANIQYFLPSQFPHHDHEGEVILSDPGLTDQLATNVYSLDTVARYVAKNACEENLRELVRTRLLSNVVLLNAGQMNSADAIQTLRTLLFWKSKSRADLPLP